MTTETAMEKICEIGEVDELRACYSPNRSVYISNLLRLVEKLQGPSPINDGELTPQEKSLWQELRSLKFCIMGTTYEEANTFADDMIAKARECYVLGKTTQPKEK